MRPWPVRPWHHGRRGFRPRARVFAQISERPWKVGDSFVGGSLTVSEAHARARVGRIRIAGRGLAVAA